MAWRNDEFSQFKFHLVVPGQVQLTRYSGRKKTCILNMRYPNFYLSIIMVVDQHPSEVGCLCLIWIWFATNHQDLRLGTVYLQSLALYPGSQVSHPSFLRHRSTTEYHSHDTCRDCWKRTSTFICHLYGVASVSHAVDCISHRNQRAILRCCIATGYLDRPINWQLA